MTPSFFRIDFNLIGVIATGGMPGRRERKHEKLEPPGAIVVSMKISTEPKNKEQEKPGTAGIGLPKQ